MLLNFCLGLSLITLTAATAACDAELDPADDPKNIERPCELCNLKCIQEYFAQHSDCKISNEHVDSIYFKTQKIQLPHANMTADFNDMRLTNIFATILEFYINKVTDKTVFTIQIPAMRFFSPKSTLKFKRKCKEENVRSGLIKCQYGCITLTMVIPRTCNLNIKEAETFTYIDDPTLKYTLDDKIYSVYKNKDPVAGKELKFILASLPVALQEVFVKLGPSLMEDWFQRKICRFPTGKKHFLFNY